MKSDEWQKIKETFNAIIELPKTEQAAYLTTCDANLRQEVEKLIKAHENANDFIVEPAFVEVGFIDETATDFYIGKQIDDYKILEEIGHGGMGTVYLAVKSDETFDKKVAIKLIKRGMDTSAVLKRFVMERKILAQLENPNIASLLDGGSTGEGLPYLVMEYIEGLPVTKFCDLHNLDTSERLKLFQKICAAVSYAHQNLVVHRDIKPSNILITKDGTPKLLDFGIAKLLHPDWSLDTNEATATIFRVMTPEYASPEQIRGLPITTASDVYSLGVVLYELLTGIRPYKIESHLPQEAANIILTEEPIRPSAVGSKNTNQVGEPSTNKDQIPKTANQKENRKSQIANRKLLKGDLDNIILKALRKEPERRYLSVQEFSEDIRRHLVGLPVTATADTTFYRINKFVKRHRAGVLASFLVLFSLLVGITATVWQAHLANLERDKSEMRFRQVRKLANTVLFEYHDGIEKLPGSTALREKMVKDALEYLDNLSVESGNDADLQRELAMAYQKVGDVQSNINAGTVGNVKGALDSFQKSLKIRQTLVASNPENAEDLFTLAVAYGRVGDSIGVFDENARLENYQQALKIYENLNISKPSDTKFSNGLAQGHLDLGVGLKTIRANTEAVENYRKAVSIWENLLAADSSNFEYRRNLAQSYKRLSEVFDLNEDYTNSIELSRKALIFDEERMKAFPENLDVKTDLSFSYGGIGYDLMKTGDLENAFVYLNRALKLRLEVAEADPKRVRGSLARAYGRLGEIAQLRGDINGAIDNFQRVIVISEELTAKDASDISVKILLGQTFEKLGFSYQKLASKNKDQQLHKKACLQFQNSIKIWETIAQEKQLLPWQIEASEKVKKNSAKCETEKF